MTEETATCSHVRNFNPIEWIYRLYEPRQDGAVVVITGACSDTRAAYGAGLRDLG